MTTWVVCDTDGGILRRESSRRAAVEWLKSFLGGEVLNRHAYGPGRFEYSIGHRGDEDADSLFVVRADRLRAGGWDLEQSALYPSTVDPYDHVERDQDSLEESTPTGPGTSCWSGRGAPSKLRGGHSG